MEKGFAALGAVAAWLRTRTTRLGPLVAREWFWFEACCAGVTVMSLAVIATDLGDLPFWIDESIAVLPARSIHTFGLPKSPFDLNYMAPQLQDGLWDPSAPLYRYTVAAVTAVVGFSEATTRGLSVLLGALMLIPCYALFRRVFGGLTAALAIAMLVSLPVFAHEAREARHFTFVALMMASTFYFLARSAESSPTSSARGLWPVFMVACLLGHFIGYLIVPIVVTVLLSSRSLLLSRRFVVVYVVLGAVYGAVMWRWGRTLPLFHDIGCHNRKFGCELDPLFYAKLVLDFLGGEGAWRYALGTLGEPTSFQALTSVVLPLGFLGLGIGASVKAAARTAEMRPLHLLVLAWLVLPIFLLSTRELKFQRYVFYVLPPLSVLIARGAVLASEWRVFRSFRSWALWVMAAILIAGPVGRLSGNKDHSRLMFASRLSTLFQVARGGIVKGPLLLSREQGAFLREHMKPGDVAVTSFDDAGLGYYSGRFVYGFLNSEHDDRFFLDLLADTAARGGTLWYVDFLPAFDECHTPGMRPRSIPCRDKYAGFYAACMPSSVAHHPACKRIRVEAIQ